jgi:hypothetical protein
MEIQGPFNLAINDNSETGVQELHLSFKSDFQQLPLAKRLQTLQQHLHELQQNIARESNDASRQGMHALSQLVEQVYPQLAADEIPLNETLIIEMAPSQSVPLNDLLRSTALK